MLHSLRILAKDLLAIGWIRRAYEFFNRIVLEALGGSRALAHVLFTLFPLTFNREQAAVLRGRRNYYRLKGRDRSSHVELRRNIHRLEKGLIMVPRRPIFALDYIEETFEFYSKAAVQFARYPLSMDAGEIQWAHDVLCAYFAACTQLHPVIDAVRERFAELPWAGGNAGMAPSAKSARGQSRVSPADLMELAKQRRSVRLFDNRQVPRETIDQALSLAALAPTACNRMPYEFRIYDDAKIVKRVADIPFGTVGYSDQIPTIAVLVGKLDSYFSPRDRHAIYIDSSLAAMSFMFALESSGLSTCAINWPDVEPLESKMQKLLGLDITERVIMLIAIGFERPGTLVPYSQKKQLATFRSYNRIAK